MRSRSGHRAVTGLAFSARAAVALLSLTVLVASGVVYARFRQFQAQVATVQAIDPSTRPKVDIDGRDQNILLTGNDDRETATAAQLREIGTTRDGGSLNTDTMMIVHIPADGRRAAAISFPRDSWVDIPGHGHGRLNSAYATGYNETAGTVQAKRTAGSRLLVRTLQQLTGLTIDHYVQVDLIGFFLISNAIDGVDVCLKHAQHEVNSGIDLPAGWSHIQGRQALAFVRQRYGLPRFDLDRIVRQQYFLSAVFRTMTSEGVLTNPFRLNRLLDAVSRSLTVDSGLHLLDLARQLQPLTAGNLSFTQVPTSPTTIAGNDVLIIDPGGMKARIAAMIGTPTKPTEPTKPTTPVTPTNPTKPTAVSGRSSAAAPTPAVAVPVDPDRSNAGEVGCID